MSKDNESSKVIDLSDYFKNKEEIKLDNKILKLDDENENDSLSTPLEENTQENDSLSIPVEKNTQENRNAKQQEEIIDKLDENESLPQRKEPGKKINQEGEAEDSGTKKTLKAVGRGAAAYFSGGSSIGKDKLVTDNSRGDHLIGVVSDAVDKVPGIKQVTDAVDESGVADVANDVMDMIGDIKEGDVLAAIQKEKEIKKSSSKFKKFVTKKILFLIGIPFTILFLLITIVFLVVSPVVGGFLEVTDTTEAFDGDDYSTELIQGEEFEDAIGEVAERYGDYSTTRQNIIAAAVSALGRPYNWGGHPEGPGLDGIPSLGLDCGGYVQWVLWTALGSNPGSLTTATISDLIGTKFIQISESELQPGDIGLKYRGYNSKVQNHTGIYAGDGKWLHAKGKKWGIVAGNYSGFTVFLRYVDVQ